MEKFWIMTSWMRIQLTKGFSCIVDANQYAWLSQWKWTYSNGYAIRMVRIDGKDTIFRMHRVIVGASNLWFVDHIDMNTLNNRVGNLRLATKAQNSYNRLPPKTNKSGIKGVSFERYTQKWKAQITINGKNINLGRFEVPEEAAKVYDAAATKYHGKFARLNNAEV